VGKYIDRKKI